MSQGETIKKAGRPSSIFASELVICGLIVGMGFRDPLSTFKFRSHSVDGCPGAV